MDGKVRGERVESRLRCPPTSPNPLDKHRSLAALGEKKGSSPSARTTSGFWTLESGRRRDDRRMGLPNKRVPCAGEKTRSFRERKRLGVNPALSPPIHRG